jgi:aspartyl-tRNA(Asn)/glutamyl-tRNA(Gln) amidotransferase subunit C
VVRPMKIPLQEAKYIAGLAKLRLTEDQLLLFTEQLSTILDYMEKLNEVDTRVIAPTYHALRIPSSLREDIVEGSLGKKEAMANAPQKDGNFFSVPKVI